MAKKISPSALASAVFSESSPRYVAPFIDISLSLFKASTIELRPPSFAISLSLSLFSSNFSLHISLYLPTSSGMCTMPVEVTSSQLHTNGIFPKIAVKAILYPRVVVNIVISHKTISKKRDRDNEIAREGGQRSHARKENQRNVERQRDQEMAKKISPSTPTSAVFSESSSRYVTPFIDISLSLFMASTIELRPPFFAISLSRSLLSSDFSLPISLYLLTSIPCRFGMCTMPVEVTSSQLHTNGIFPKTTVKGILYPRVVVNIVISHKTIPKCDNLLTIYNLTNVKNASVVPYVNKAVRKKEIGIMRLQEREVEEVMRGRKTRETFDIAQYASLTYLGAEIENITS
ncbi:hypothetical protein ACLOJK_016373 [Asimina triloba]